MHARAILPLLFALILAPAGARAGAANTCTGDCNGTGTVTVDELVRGVNIALGNVELSACTSFDRDGNGLVSVDELVAAVNHALGGCPVQVPPATARRITEETAATDLIGGPLAVGRVGDYLIANHLVRAVIRDRGRSLSFMLTYGGHIVDADIVRPPGETGRDNFGAMMPLLNIASTENVTEIQVVNNGENGQPAVIRTLGIDDLFDPIDPTNAIRGFAGIELPESVRDVDLPVELMTEYRLAPGSRAIEIETFVHNLGTEELRIYAGDFVNGSGELDTFVPGLGFGDSALRVTMPFLAYTGINGAAGLSYGVIPPPGSSAFAQSGLTIYLTQSLLGALGGLPGALVIPAGGTNSYVRHFVIGAGDVDSIAEVSYRLAGVETGRVRGRVTAGGRPAPGALISAVKPDPSTRYNVVSSFQTDESGNYDGSLPVDSYSLIAKLPGHPYESGTTEPTRHPITVAANAEIRTDIALPETAQLRVTAVEVTDGGERPVPAKVSIVGFDPTPDPLNELAGLAGLSIRGFTFRSPVKQKGTVLFGLTDVRFVPIGGDTGPQPLVPGTYDVVVSRGPEYSVHRERVTLAPGDSRVVHARLVRVLETPGFVSSDYHVHMINSPDSAVTRDERILTMAAEGVEYFVASDHDFLTDLSGDIDRLGASDFVRSVVSCEVTTFNLGHYNAWPLRRDPSSITGGAPDWGRAGVAPGRDYPSLGSFDLSPAELFADIRTRFEPDARSGVLQINHINDELLGFFHIAGIDTALVPPRSFTRPELIRQNPAITNLYDDDYEALELWIEASRAQTALFFDANLGDWFNLLNQGRIKTGTADSDTHHTAAIQAGGPRNYVASSSDLPAELDHAELADSIAAGRSSGSNAPFVRVLVEGDEGEVGGLGLNQNRLVAATGRAATVRVHVQSPLWAEFDTVQLYANVVPSPVPDMNANGARVPRYTVAPTAEKKAGTDFTVERVVVNPLVSGAERLEAEVEFTLAPERDTWVVIVVRGTDGVSRPLWPMNPQDLDPTTNQTLDDLADGNRGELGNLATAFTNPVLIDVDGNGRFDAPMAVP